MIRYLTGGESHGKVLTAIVEGLPSGIRVSSKDINEDLKRRQGGYGRGGRMAIESDAVEFLSGLRFSRTLGSPLTMEVKNKDWENWQKVMAYEGTNSAKVSKVTKPRPGHADLTGVLKYDSADIRDILERSSARETAVRVAVGSLCKSLLKEFGINVYSWVTEIGGVGATSVDLSKNPSVTDIVSAYNKAEKSQVRLTASPQKEKLIIKAIDNAKKRGDSLGGTFNIAVIGVCPGLGSHAQWDRKLDALIAYALMSVQATKSVEVGIGHLVSSTPGSLVHDEIYYKNSKAASGATWPLKRRFFRNTNRAGGIEGGMSNGETIWLSASMKPIPTLYKPLKSVDIKSKKPFQAAIERSDICAVPAASVVAESVVAIEIAKAFLDKFGGDSIKEIKRNYKGYLSQISRY